MPRISQINMVEQPDLSDALEWFEGDAATLQGIVESDDDAREPVDLTGATISFACEFYTADVAEGIGRSASIAISNFQRDEARANRVIAAVADPNQDENPGRFTLALPADLLPGDAPAADIATGVPVGLCYLRKTQAGDVRTTRFLIIFRRGYPE